MLGIKLLAYSYKVHYTLFFFPSLSVCLAFGSGEGPLLQVATQAIQRNVSPKKYLQPPQPRFREQLLHQPGPAQHQGQKTEHGNNKLQAGDSVVQNAGQGKQQKDGHSARQDNNCKRARVDKEQAEKVSDKKALTQGHVCLLGRAPRVRQGGIGRKHVLNRRKWGKERNSAVSEKSGAQ